MQIFIALVLVAAIGVFLYKQHQKSKAEKVPEPRGVKDQDDRHG